MVNLRSAHVSVIEKDTGRSVICDVSDFLYTLDLVRAQEAAALYLH